MKKLSEFYGESTGAAVYKDKNVYFTTVKSRTGIHYTSRFETEKDAENYAKDWVNKNE